MTCPTAGPISKNIPAVVLRLFTESPSLYLAVAGIVFCVNKMAKKSPLAEAGWLKN